MGPWGNRLAGALSPAGAQEGVTPWKNKQVGMRDAERMGVAFCRTMMEESLERKSCMIMMKICVLNSSFYFNSPKLKSQNKVKKQRKSISHVSTLYQNSGISIHILFCHTGIEKCFWFLSLCVWWSYLLSPWKCSASNSQVQGSERKLSWKLILHQAFINSIKSLLFWISIFINLANNAILDVGREPTASTLSHPHTPTHPTLFCLWHRVVNHSDDRTLTVESGPPCTITMIEYGESGSLLRLLVLTASAAMQRIDKAEEPH